MIRRVNLLDFIEDTQADKKMCGKKFLLLEGIAITL